MRHKAFKRVIFEDAINLDVVISAEFNGEEISLIIVKNNSQDEVRINGFDAGNFLFEFSDGSLYCVDVSDEKIVWIDMSEITQKQD